MYYAWYAQNVDPPTLTHLTGFCWLLLPNKIDHCTTTLGLCSYRVVNCKIEGYCFLLLKGFSQNSLPLQNYSTSSNNFTRLPSHYSSIYIWDFCHTAFLFSSPFCICTFNGSIQNFSLNWYYTKKITHDSARL